MDNQNRNPEVGSTSVPECGATGNQNALKMQKSYPDKERTPTSIQRFQSSGSITRSRMESIFSRRSSTNGYSSSEESLGTFHRVWSEGNTPTSCRPIRYLIGTPTKLSSKDSEDCFQPKKIIRELSRDDYNGENRPPSPRPEGAMQICLERNRQMQIWEDWVVLKKIKSTDMEIASTSFRRVEEKVGSATPLPKSLMAEESDSDSDY